MTTSISKRFEQRSVRHTHDRDNPSSIILKHKNNVNSIRDCAVCKTAIHIFSDCEKFKKLNTKGAVTQS